MIEFDNKEFGKRIKNYRINKGLSQENLAMVLKKSRTLISRYESGEIMPDAKDISIICNELGIYEADLFADNNTIKLSENNRIENPFGTNRLYVYFNAFNFRTKKFSPDMYILELEQKQNICKVQFVDAHDNRIYSTGYLMGNSEIVFAVMENYQPTSTRADISVMEINISSGTDNLMLGGYFGTNAKCEPSLRKCYFSKRKVEFTQKMLEDLKLDENEKELIENQNAMYLDIFKN